MKLSVLLNKKPSCDFCSNEANYDAKTKMGAWAFLCENHFQEYGVGLGLGKGQKIEVAK